MSGLRAMRALALLAGMAAVGLAAGQETSRQEMYDKLLKQHGKSLVTIKFVLKVQMGNFGDSENEQEITGVMIDPKGLVLCSNTQLGGVPAMFRNMMGGNLTATPTDLRVLIGDDTEGLEAELTTRDSEYDLAWVKIKEPGDASFDYLDLSGGAEIELGDRLLTVSQMGKYFGRAMLVSESRAAGFTEKPRRLIVPASGSGEIGLPVFTESGALAGLTVVQLPDVDTSGGNPMAMMGAMSEMQRGMSGLILPAADVRKATDRARMLLEDTEEE